MKVYIYIYIPSPVFVVSIREAAAMIEMDSSFLTLFSVYGSRLHGMRMSHLFIFF